jgi:hypothetical protein
MLSDLHAFSAYDTRPIHNSSAVGQDVGLVGRIFRKKHTVSLIRSDDTPSGHCELSQDERRIGQEYSLGRTIKVAGYLSLLPIDNPKI